MPSNDEDFADVVEGSSEQPHSAIHSVATFKLPPFWSSRPKLWFTRAEVQFWTHRLANDSSQLDKIIYELNPEYLAQVTDLIETPFAAEKFQALKERLTSAFAVSEKKELQELLNGLELGDQRPSQRLKSASRVSEAFLKSLWLRRLLEDVRKMLSASEIKDLSRLIKMADRLYEARDSAYVAAVELPKPPLQLDAMQKELCALRSEFSKADTGRGSRSSLNRSFTVAH